MTLNHTELRALLRTGGYKITDPRAEVLGLLAAI